MNDQLCVHVEGPGGLRQRVSFGPGVVVWLGRDPACQLQLSAPNISRRHVSLCLQGQSLVVADNSQNGTRVAGALLQGGSKSFAASRLTLQVGSFRVVARRRDDSPAPSQVSADVVALRRRIHRNLLDRLELAHLPVSQTPSAELREKVGDALRSLVDAAPLPQGQVPAQWVAELLDEALGLGPLERLMHDARVSEVMVVDPSTIYAEIAGRLELTELRFTDAEAVRSAIERIVTPLGRRIDESSPLVDARLADGSRVNAVIPPLATRGPCITIRKFPERQLTLRELLAKGAMSEAMGQLLESAVTQRRNVVISGGTGSGKTTLLNVLSSVIPSAERIITIEDAAELRLAQPHVVSLESRPPNLEGKGEYTIRALLKNALRMRPDRIIVGECRGGEALDMLQAMNTGHEGSMTTTHANSPREAITRVETLCLMAGLDLPIGAIRRQIAGSVHLIVQQSRASDGARRITSISEVLGVDDDGEVELAELFAYRDGRFRPSGLVPRCVRAARAQGTR